MRRPYLFLFIVLYLVIYPAHVWSGHKVKSPCKIRYPSDSGIEWECRRIKKGERIENLFGDRWIDIVRFNRIDRRHAVPGVSIKVPKRLKDIENFSPMPHYYEPARDEAKFILIDLSEQFLGAYEYGRLVFSTPVASGEKGNETPVGDFRVTAYNSRHRSSLYFIEKTNIPYPMHYGLRFHISKDGVAYWIHGRDVPGYPASHGCVGLYDEEMQKRYYKYPAEPKLQDSKRLFEWVLYPVKDDGRFHTIKDGPRVKIIGHAP
jgi:hypothetical protein